MRKSLRCASTLLAGTLSAMALTGCGLSSGVRRAPLPPIPQFTGARAADRTMLVVRPASDGDLISGQLILHNPEGQDHIYPVNNVIPMEAGWICMPPADAKNLFEFFIQVESYE